MKIAVFGIARAVWGFSVAADHFGSTQAFVGPMFAAAALAGLVVGKIIAEKYYEGVDEKE